MRYVEHRCCLAGLAFSVSVSIRAVAFSADPPLPPSVEFGELYHVVEMAGLFSDQKTFADAIPEGPPPQIMADYRKQKQLPGFDLKAFVALHFATPKEHFEVYKRRPNRSVGDYIHDMWEVLRREADEVEPYSSLLPLVDLTSCPEVDFAKFTIGIAISQCSDWSRTVSMTSRETCSPT